MVSLVRFYCQLLRLMPSMRCRRVIAIRKPAARVPQMPLLPLLLVHRISRTRGGFVSWAKGQIMVSSFFPRQPNFNAPSLGHVVDIFAPGCQITSCLTGTKSVSTSLGSNSRLVMISFD